jgi:hypothetical protein
MTRLFTLTAGIVALAGTFAAAASAQLAPGRSGSSSMSYLGQDQVWDAVSEFGTCYAAMNKTEAFSLIATEPNSRAEAETYRRLFSKPYQSCLGDVVSLRVAVSMVRGAIAEGLYRKHIPLPSNLAQSVPAVGQIHNLSQAALCYTASHPGEARSVVLGTRPGSRKEFDAVVAMMPEFSRCIPAGARNTAFDATQIRFRLAEALLRTGVPSVLPATTK